MKNLVLVLIVVTKMLLPGSNQVIRIDIVLPRHLVPYYDWLIEFPGWQPGLEEPNPGEIWIEYGDNQGSRIIKQNTDTISI